MDLQDTMLADIKEQNMKSLFDIQLDDDEFDYLMCEHAKGKELKVVNGKVVAVERVITEEDLNGLALYEKTTRLTELTKDFAQVQAGLIIEDIEDRKSEFRTLLNEVRVLQGKEPRNAIDSE